MSLKSDPGFIIICPDSRYKLSRERDMSTVIVLYGVYKRYTMKQEQTSYIGAGDNTGIILEGDILRLEVG